MTHYKCNGHLMIRVQFPSAINISIASYFQEKALQNIRNFILFCANFNFFGYKDHSKCKNRILWEYVFCTKIRHFLCILQTSHWYLRHIVLCWSFNQHTNTWHFKLSFCINLTANDRIEQQVMRKALKFIFWSVGCVVLVRLYKQGLGSFCSSTFAINQRWWNQKFETIHPWYPCSWEW